MRWLGNRRNNKINWPQGFITKMHKLLLNIMICIFLYGCSQGNTNPRRAEIEKRRAEGKPVYGDRTKESEEDKKRADEERQKIYEEFEERSYYIFPAIERQCSTNREFERIVTELTKLTPEQRKVKENEYAYIELIYLDKLNEEYLNAINTLLNYKNNWDLRFEEGYKKGYSRGYNVGLSEGKDMVSYDSGYKKGKREAEIECEELHNLIVEYLNIEMEKMEIIRDIDVAIAQKEFTRARILIDNLRKKIDIQKLKFPFLDENANFLIKSYVLVEERLSLVRSLEEKHGNIILER
jgi:hypothetical protein